MQKVALDAGGAKAGIVRLQEDHAHNVVANVSLPLKLLWIVLFVGQQSGHVKHDLDITPIGVDGKETYKY